MINWSYPIGKFESPHSWDMANISGWIDTIEAFPSNLSNALTGKSDTLLDQPYRPGGWTVRQLVHHTADSHLNAYVRFRWILTEDRPTIKPYDQEAWAELPDAKSADVEISLALLEGVHARWGLLMRSLTQNQWESVYFHPEHTGEQVLAHMLAHYDWHCRHHLAHVQKASTIGSRL